MTTVADQPLWSARDRVTTTGVFALAFLVAFESFAVATVMPLVGHEFGDYGSYALAFAAPTAVSVFGIRLAGPWIDRAGPGPALYTGVAVFAGGVVGAAAATDMTVFLAARAVQGLGAGLVGVSLYVVVAAAYPEQLRARVFTVLTSAWLLPALLGPPLAGALADGFGWRWVFAVAPVPAVVAVAALIPALRGTNARGAGDQPWSLGRGAVAAVAVMGLGVAGQRSVTGWPVVLLVSLVAVAWAVPRLLPRGTWRFDPGLPALLAARTLAGAAFFGVEVYVPLALVQFRGYSPAAAGGFLTLSAVAWFAGSWLAAHARMLADPVRRIRIGVVALVAAIPATATVAAPAVRSIVPLLGWGLAGLGIGLAFVSASVLLLDWSPPEHTGANTAAMQVNDAVGQSLWLSVGAVVFGLSHAAGWGFAAVFAGAAVVAAAAGVASGRLRVSGPATTS
ncbi:MFS transporter [Rhodococcus sp. 2H158]